MLKNRPDLRIDQTTIIRNKLLTILAEDEADCEGRSFSFDTAEAAEVEAVDAIHLDAVTTALLLTLYAQPLGCWAQNRPKIEATLTTVTCFLFSTSEADEMASVVPLSTPIKLISKHLRQPSFSPKK